MEEGEEEIQSGCSYRRAGEEGRCKVGRVRVLNTPLAWISITLLMTARRKHAGTTA